MSNRIPRMPVAVAGNYDPLSHTNVGDLIYIAEHELTLYAEGEDTDIVTARDLRSCRKYIAALEKLDPEQKV